MIEIYFDGTLINSDNYISFNTDYKQFDESFMLGTTASNTITLEVPSSIAIPNEVLVKIDSTNYATMIVDTYEYKDNNILKLNLVDKMVLLNFNYDAKPIVPCTVKQILQDICSKANITLATTSFVNDSVLVNFYDNELTARDYVGYIAELNGGFARINTSGQLELVKFKGTPTNISIDTCEDFRVGEKHKIERVVFDNGLLKFETSTDETKETLYLNNQNVYINDKATFDNITNEILNFEFYNFSTGNCEIKSNVKAGDLIKFTDGTNNYQTIAQYSLNYVGGLNGGYELNINSERQEETKYEGVGNSVKSLKVRLNRDENVLSITAKSVEDISTPTKTVNGETLHIEDAVDSEIIELDIDGKTIQEPILPSEYTQVDYIESDGTQYIDTGYLLSSNNLKYEAKARITQQGNYTLWGTKRDTSNGWALNPYANTGYGGNLTFWSNTTQVSGLTYSNTEVPTNTDFKIVGQQNDTSVTTTVNGITKTATGGVWEYPQTVTYKVFSAGDASQRAHMRLYYLKLYDNNVLVRDFIPCYRNSDYKVGLYDMVNGVFYTNAGTGLFIYGGVASIPNPDYPSPLVSVGYENLFDYTTSTFSNPSKVSIIAENNQLTITTTTATTSNNLFFLTKIPDELLKNGETYTISSENVSGVAQSLKLQLRNKDGSYASGKSQSNSVVYDDNYSLYVDGNIYATTGSTSIPSGTVAIIKNIQVVKDIQAHSYIPYGKYGIEYKIVGKNLWSNKIFQKEDTTYNGVTLKVIGEGRYQLSGTNTSTSSWKFNFTVNYNFNENVTISSPSKIANTKATYIINNVSKAFTDTYVINDGNITQFAISIQGSASFSDDIIEFQIERGNNATYFEPPKEETKIIELKEPLRSIDDIKDTAEIKNNKLIITRRIGYEKILSSAITAFASVMTNTKEARMPKTKLSLPMKTGKKLLSNRYRYTNNTWRNDTLGLVAEAGDPLIYIAFRIPASENATYFDEHITYLQYILETPTIDEYQIDMPHTFKGINNITTLDELKPNLTLTYIRDTAINSYVEGQIIKEQTIRKEQISSLEITDSEIKSDVFQAQNDITNITKTYEGLSQRIDANKATLEKQEKSFDSDGNVIAVKVKEGISFNEDGLQIYSDENQFKTHINEQGTVYTDGNNIVGQYTKDGSKQKDLTLYGIYSYGQHSIDDEPMFIGQLYTDENGEECFGHFINID